LGRAQLPIDGPSTGAENPFCRAQRWEGSPVITHELSKVTTWPDDVAAIRHLIGTTGSSLRDGDEREGQAAPAGQARRDAPAHSRRELTNLDLAARVRLSAQEKPDVAAQLSFAADVNLLALNSLRYDRRTVVGTDHQNDPLGSTRTRSERQLQPALSRRTPSQVADTSHAQSRIHQLQYLSTRGEEMAEQLTVTELLEPGLPTLGSAPQPIIYASQLRRDHCLSLSKTRPVTEQIILN
jgi:hypothetical protein